MNQSGYASSNGEQPAQGIAGIGLLMQQVWRRTPAPVHILDGSQRSLRRHQARHWHTLAPLVRSFVPVLGHLPIARLLLSRHSADAPQPLVCCWHGCFDFRRPERLKQKLVGDGASALTEERWKDGRFKTQRYLPTAGRRPKHQGLHQECRPRRRLPTRWHSLGMHNCFPPHFNQPCASKILVGL